MDRVMAGVRTGADWTRIEAHISALIRLRSRFDQTQSLGADGMSIDIPEIERIKFFPGQRLTADDMTDLDVTNAELRWLHNRSLHPWGIGIGLEVSGEKGDTVVTVKPGYAVDILGRELIVSSEH